MRFIFATGISDGIPPPMPDVTRISPLRNSGIKGVNVSFNSEELLPVKIPLSRLLDDITGILELMSVMSVTLAYLPLMVSILPISPDLLTTAFPGVILFSFVPMYIMIELEKELLVCAITFAV